MVWRRWLAGSLPSLAPLLHTSVHGRRVDDDAVGDDAVGGGRNGGGGASSSSERSRRRNTSRRRRTASSFVSSIAPLRLSATLRAQDGRQEWNAEKMGVAEDFRRDAQRFCRLPTVAGKASLDAHCLSLREEDARILLSEVTAAYEGHGDPAEWLSSSPHSLRALFDIGDLVDRLAAAAGGMPPPPSSAPSDDGGREEGGVADTHRAHALRLEADRLASLRTSSRNASEYDSLLRDGFRAVEDPFVRHLLSSPDSSLLSVPPVRWSSLAWEAQPLPVSRALCHRLSSFSSSQGRAALPSSVHATLSDLSARDASSAPPPPPINHSPSSPSLPPPPSPRTGRLGHGVRRTCHAALVQVRGRLLPWPRRTKIHHVAVTKTATCAGHALP